MSDPMVLRAIPVLPSLDLERTLEFYVEKLGFAARIDLDNLVGVSRDDVELHSDPDMNLITFAEAIA